MSDSIKLLLTLSSTYSHFNKKIDRTLSVHGLSFSEFLVLHHLHESANKMMSRIELADAVSLTPSGITRLLNPMEKNRLVEKEKNNRDARVSLVKLTSPGIEIYQNALSSCENFSELLAKNITKKQLIILIDILEKLR